LARRASAIAKLRRQENGTLILDAGDALLPSPRPPSPGLLNKADTMVRAHGLLGLDAMAPGEAEIAVGLDRLTRISRQTSQTLLCANLVPRGRRNPFTPRKLVESGGVKVGLVGLFALQPQDKGGAKLLREARLRQLDPAKAARAQVKALERQGAELVLALAHVGIQQAKDLARKVEGIHLMIVAHTGHQLSVPLLERGTLLVESGRRGQKLGHLQVRLGAGWSPTDSLADDSRRFNLYRDAQKEIEALRKQHAANPTRKIPAQDPRLLRATALAQRYKKAANPRGPHTLIGTLVTLDTSFPDEDAIKGLISASKGTWHIRAPAKRPKGAARSRTRID
jgi:2',3'-cyclic-nucleotide 2'-phosphodiesterase (5'-nucleotidase family)